MVAVVDITFAANSSPVHVVHQARRIAIGYNRFFKPFILAAVQRKLSAGAGRQLLQFRRTTGAEDFEACKIGDELSSLGVVFGNFVCCRLPRISTRRGFVVGTTKWDSHVLSSQF